MNSVVAVPSCPRCGVAIPAEAPGGLCPRCVLLGAATPSESGGPPRRLEPPPLERVRAAFPQLEIRELIGQGGMGFVYSARQPQLDRVVALKLLPVEAGSDPSFVERFGREGRLLARLNHPNIVSVYEFGQAAGFCFLVMEFVDGVNLRQAMRSGRFSSAEALAIVPKICEALQYAHEQGVLHRDIKPENILLDGRGRVKIADFGIAKLVGEHTTDFTLTASGARLGTPHYMAPEQIESPSEVDHRADIYSLGVVFYELLTGELPLGRFAAPSAKADLDARVDEIVMRALAKERELRQQSAGELKTEVEGLAAPIARPVAANRPNLSDRTTRLAGWVVFGAAAPAVMVGGFAATNVLSDSSWNPGPEELRVTLGIWLTAIVTPSVGALLLRLSRREGAAISRGTVATAWVTGLLLGLACLGGLFALSPHFGGLIFAVLPALAALALLLRAMGQPAMAIAGATASPLAGGEIGRTGTISRPRFEYRSTRTLYGLPLLHIVRGTDPATGREREARGVLAIGGRATGVLAIGGLAQGVFAFGGVAFGLFAFGGLAFGGAAVGGLALGLISYGGLAVGLILALGGIAAGWSGFGGLVVAHQGFGGFMAAGERLPATDPAGALIRWLLPWLWLPVVPLSLVPGLVSAWAYRKLDPHPDRPRPNPWPHRLFWLIMGLLALPASALLAALLGPVLQRVTGGFGGITAGLVPMLTGVALVWLFVRSRPTPAQANPQTEWNPWPKRIFWGAVLLLVLPAFLLFVGLIVWAQPRRSAAFNQWAEPIPAPVSSQMIEQPQNNSELSTTRQIMSPGPVGARLKPITRTGGPGWFKLSWVLESPGPGAVRLTFNNRSAIHKLEPTGEPGLYGAEITVLYDRPVGELRVIMTVTAEGKKRTGLPPVSLLGDPDTVLAKANELVAGELVLAPNTPVWIAFGGLEQVRLEMVPDIQTSASVPGVLTNPVFVPDPVAALELELAEKRLLEARKQAELGMVAPQGKEVLDAELAVAQAESKLKGDPLIAAEARLKRAQQLLTIAQRRHEVGNATTAEVDEALLEEARARATLEASPTKP